jgi:hypothetical protein
LRLINESAKRHPPRYVGPTAALRLQSLRRRSAALAYKPMKPPAAMTGYFRQNREESNPQLSISRRRAYK